jgi:hypothetical protein
MRALLSRRVGGPWWLTDGIEEVVVVGRQTARRAAAHRLGGCSVRAATAVAAGQRLSEDLGGPPAVGAWRRMPGGGTERV